MIRKVQALFALLLLSVFLASGTAYAAPASGPAVQERTPGLLAAVWEWVTSLVEARLPLQQAHEAVEGVLPVPPTSGPGTDGGGFIDPSGGN